MKVCSLRASARAAARLRRGVRRGVARRLDARLRRPSRPALSPLARDELRPGAVGVGPRLVGARLAWALRPSLLGLLARWAEDERPLSPMVPPLLAAVTLLHPAQLPAAVVLVVLAACARGPWWQRARGALGALVLAAALTAFWTLPLLLRLAETRALAWGTLSLGEVARPLPIVLAALAVAGLLDRTPAGAGERLALWSAVEQ